mmetsp:Transcript_103404/g.211085  ORF Transcript_103404/g.211085 Transcript_103404/m.211085 type:complete len:127 (-) Transcript_103404:2334-2714(-)
MADILGCQQGRSNKYRCGRIGAVFADFDWYVGVSHCFHSLSRLEVDKGIGWNHVFLLHRLLGAGGGIRITVHSVWELEVIEKNTETSEKLLSRQRDKDLGLGYYCDKVLKVNKEMFVPDVVRFMFN